MEDSTQTNHHPDNPMNVLDQILFEGPDASVPLTPHNGIWELVDSWVIDPEDHDNSSRNDHQVQQDVDELNGANRDHIEDQYPEDEQDELPLKVVWPSAPVPDSCSSCQVFREITHTNGTHITILEIHGEMGLISHAIYKSNHGFDASDIQNHHMLDFCKQTLEDIREYLKDYIEEYRKDGYILMQDHLSSFYEALCLGYDWLNPDRRATDVQTNKSGLFEQGETSNQANNPIIMGSQEVPTMFRTELSIQRERIKKMTLEDFAKYFDLPIDAASKQLCLCATVIKKKIRSFKIPRWPYRKVKSIQRKISLLKEGLKANGTGVDHGVELEIQKLQRQLDAILSGSLKP